MTIPPLGLHASTGRAQLRADRKIVRRRQERRWLALLLWRRAHTHMKRRK